MKRPPASSTPFPYPTLFRSVFPRQLRRRPFEPLLLPLEPSLAGPRDSARAADRKSTRLNSSHSQISYALFCLKKKKRTLNPRVPCTPMSDDSAQLALHQSRD